MRENDSGEVFICPALFIKESVHARHLVVTSDPCGRTVVGAGCVWLATCMFGGVRISDPPNHNKCSKARNPLNGATSAKTHV